MKNEIPSETAEVHWYEGMFLLPHHYQAAARRNMLQEREKITTTDSWWWGIVDLQLSATALTGNRIKIERALLRLKDGTWINIPDNAFALEKSFEESLGLLDTGMPVWIGVRRPESHRPQVHELGEEEKGVPRTYVLKESKLVDENTGANEQPVQSRLWNVQIFFGDNPGDQYEVLKVGELVWSSAKQPVLNPGYIAPLLNMASSSALSDRVKNLVVKLNNLAAFMQGELAARRIALTTDPMQVLINLTRLQVAASGGLVLQQILSVDHSHPYHLYLEIVRLAGQLVAVAPEVSLDLPAYDHDNLAYVMETAISKVENMLAGGVVVDYIQRRFEIEGEQRVCRIDLEWLNPPAETKVQIYLCISTDMAEQQVDAMLSDYRVKIGPPSRIDELLISRTRGLAAQRLRRIPSGLPDKSGLHYFQLDLSRNSEFWNDLCRDLYLVIYGIPVEVTSEITLYVHMEQGRR